MNTTNRDSLKREPTALERLRDKIAWEGGLFPALVYGIGPEEIPEEYTELRAMLDSLQRQHQFFEAAGNNFTNRLDEAIAAENAP